MVQLLYISVVINNMQLPKFVEEAKKKSDGMKVSSHEHLLTLASSFYLLFHLYGARLEKFNSVP